MLAHIQGHQPHEEQHLPMPFLLMDHPATVLKARILDHPPGNEVGTQGCHYLALHQDHLPRPRDPKAPGVSGVMVRLKPLGKVAVHLTVCP